MVNETILGGIRIALAHKSSLKDAMQSFYNAGYKKEEVEEAAKIVFEEEIRRQKGLPVQTIPASQVATQTKASPNVKVTFLDRIKYMFSKKKPITKPATTSAQTKTQTTTQTKSPQQAVQTTTAKSTEPVKTQNTPTQKTKVSEQRQEMKQNTKPLPTKKPVTKNPKNTKIILIIILSIFLILLLGVMIVLFMFKDSLF